MIEKKVRDNDSNGEIDNWKVIIKEKKKGIGNEKK
jgi:hypothetical protein